MLKSLVTSTDGIKIPEEFIKLLDEATPSELDFIATHICSYWAAGDHDACYREIDEGESEYTFEDTEELLRQYSGLIEFFSQAAGEAFYTLFQLILGKEITEVAGD